MRHGGAGQGPIVAVPGQHNRAMLPLRRRSIIALSLLALVVFGAALAFQLALRRLHGSVVAALGPRATLASVSLGWTGLELNDLRLRSAAGRWPAEDELRATRVTLVPALSSVFGGGWRLHSVTVEGGYLSLLRTRAGALRLLPGLLESPRPAAVAATASSGSKATATTTLHIGELRLRDIALDFYDASVVGRRGQPHRLRLDPLRADIGPLTLPALNGRMEVSVQATLQGPRRNGSLAMGGHLAPAAGQARLALQARGVDLIALQPYLLRPGEGAVRRGTLDLTINAKVARQQLTAPGRLTISDLDLASGGGLLNTFAGVPRQAVLAAMSRDGRIDFAFTLEGRLDDPKFSLNEALSVRLAASLAAKLGVSIGGAVQGVGSLVKGLFGR